MVCNFGNVLKKDVGNFAAEGKRKEADLTITKKIRKLARFQRETDNEQLSVRMI